MSVGLLQMVADTLKTKVVVHRRVLIATQMENNGHSWLGLHNPYTLTLSDI